MVNTKKIIKYSTYIVVTAVMVVVGVFVSSQKNKVDAGAAVTCGFNETCSSTDKNPKRHCHSCVYEGDDGSGDDGDGGGTVDGYELLQD